MAARSARPVRSGKDVTNLIVVIADRSKDGAQSKYRNVSESISLTIFRCGSATKLSIRRCI